LRLALHCSARRSGSMFSSASCSCEALAAPLAEQQRLEELGMIRRDPSAVETPPEPSASLKIIPSAVLFERQPLVRTVR
jgi:hypothetical protein